MEFMIISALSIAEGFLPSSVAVMLAFSDLEFSMLMSPIMMGLDSASFIISVLDFCNGSRFGVQKWLMAPNTRIVY